MAQYGSKGKSTELEDNEFNPRTHTVEGQHQLLKLCSALHMWAVHTHAHKHTHTRECPHTHIHTKNVPETSYKDICL